MKRLFSLFQEGETTKLDVVMHVGAAAVAIYKALDKFVDYKRSNK